MKGQGWLREEQEVGCDWSVCVDLWEMSWGSGSLEGERGYL